MGNEETEGKEIEGKEFEGEEIEGEDSNTCTETVERSHRYSMNCLELWPL
jgi:hypothetical protein